MSKCFIVCGVVFLMGTFALTQMIPDTRLEISKSSKAAASNEYHKKLNESGAQDHPTSNAAAESKMDTRPEIFKSPKAAASNEYHKKFNESGAQDHPASNAAESTTGEQDRNTWIIVVVISLEVGTTALCYVYLHAEGENVQSNYDEERAIPAVQKMRMSRLSFVAIVTDLLFLMEILVFIIVLMKTNPESARTKSDVMNSGSHVDLHKYELRENTTGEQDRNAWIAVAVIILFTVGTTIVRFVYIIWHIYCDKFCRNGYERAERKNMRSNFGEECAIPDIQNLRLVRLYFVASVTVLLLLMGVLVLIIMPTKSNPDSARHKFDVMNLRSHVDLHKYELRENTAEEKCRNTWIPVAVVISFLLGTIAGWSVCKYWRICWDKCLQNGYERAEGESVQSNFGEQRAIPGSVGTVAQVSIDIPPAGEDVRPQVPLDKPRDKVPTKKTENEDGLYKITQELARCTDLHLYSITESCQEQLESAIQDDIEHITDLLVRTHQMPEIKLEEIIQLTRSNQRLEASRQLLKLVLQGNIPNCRMLWDTLSRTHKKTQYLLTLLEHDVQEEVILQHRYNLRVQSQNMIMPKSRLISDIYVNPTIKVKECQHEDIKGEITSHDREVEIHELLKRRSSDTEKTDISMVYGGRGFGKTTLIQKIINDWATGKKHQEFRFILHFKVQNLNAIKDRITLNSLIIHTYPYLEYYLNDLWKEPNRLLFIFDDLDQFYRPFIFSDNGRSNCPQHSYTGPDSDCFVSDILRCLLQGELLKGCSVLITARLWENETLHHVAADTTVQVMGFTSEKVKDYLCRYLRHRHNVNEVVQMIQDNDILRSISSSPLFCFTVASSLESQREEQRTMPVVNHTQMLFDYVVFLLRESGYDNQTTLKCLLKFGELAYKGIARNTLLFEASTSSDLDNCPPNFTSAFMIQYPDEQNRGLVYEFRNSVMRDFLAALAKFLTTPTAQLKGLLDPHFMDTTGRFTTFSLFLVGLSSQKLTDRLNLQLCSVPSDSTLCTCEWFRNSVKRRLTNMDGNNEEHMFLHTLYCIIEFGDNIIMEELLAPMKTIKLHQLLTSSDCTVLSRTLIYSELIGEMDLSSSLPEPEEIQKLASILHRCVILRLNQNNLQDSGVKHVFKTLEKNDCKIQTLELKSNHLTDDCLGELFSALRTNHSLTLLNLSNSSQDGQHDNKFTHKTLQHHVDNYAQQKEIRWLRYEHKGPDTTSNLLYIITD